MCMGFLFRYANRGRFLGDRSCSIFSWRLSSFRDFNRLQRTDVGMGQRIAVLQLFCKLGSQRLLMVADKIACQITDSEMFEEQALGQRAEIRFQPSDDL